MASPSLFAVRGTSLFVGSTVFLSQSSLSSPLVSQGPAVIRAHAGQGRLLLGIRLLSFKVLVNQGLGLKEILVPTLLLDVIMVHSYTIRDLRCTCPGLWLFLSSSCTSLSLVLWLINSARSGNAPISQVKILLSVRMAF